MTNESQQTFNTPDQKPAPFGTRLKAAREALGLERKDAAAQLRLNEKIILMMEKDRYPIDLPVTFIRGYIRSYGKLLQIPEYEIKKAIEPIKPKQNNQTTTAPAKLSIPMTSGNYFMQFFTYLIVITIIGLVGVWWYTHTGPTTLPLLNTTENTPLHETPSPPIQPPSVIGVDSTPSQISAKTNESGRNISNANENNQISQQATATTTTDQKRTSGISNTAADPYDFDATNVEGEQ